MKIIITGRPVVLKNSKQIAVNKKTGKTFVKSNSRVEAYQHRATAEICEQTKGVISIGFPISVKMLFFGAWKRGQGNIPDLSNLYQAPEDLLQNAGVIEDDSLIESHDGSRRIYLCDTCGVRPIYKAGANKGRFKPDCGAVKKCLKERVEIEITRFAREL
jgi:Holliday junction resolvase RusA-like endonuclease